MQVYQTSYLMLQRALQVAPASDLQDIALYLEATHLIEVSHASVTATPCACEDSLLAHRQAFLCIEKGIGVTGSVDSRLQ